MEFEWDEEKNQINISKHGISFDLAKLIWEDKNNFDIFDDKHSRLDEKRWLKFGLTKDGNILCVVYTDIINGFRIISAFTDKKIERFYYEQNK
ncbi:MAG: BrnT family toxin [Cyanobacteriota bacterium]